MSQDKYNEWVSNTSPHQQDVFCGGKRISGNEEYFIVKYAKNKILDIGCGNNYRINGKSAELIKLKDNLDKMLITSEPAEIINFINNSFYKTHPIVRFSLAKAEMLACLFLHQHIDSQKFCNIINVIDEISEVTSAYRSEFINYTIHLLPSSHISLYSEDYENILTFLRIRMFDTDDKIHNKLTEQLLRTELGSKFMKEYLFYTDKQNFINDSAFLRKKEYLEEKYNSHRKELTKNNHFTWKIGE